MEAWAVEHGEDGVFTKYRGCAENLTRRELQGIVEHDLKAGFKIHRQLDRFAIVRKQL